MTVGWLCPPVQNVRIWVLGGFREPGEAVEFEGVAYTNSGLGSVDLQGDRVRAPHALSFTAVRVTIV